jgi:hypothetical protein
MNTTNPWRNGAVLAVTIAIAYTVCALVYALAPERGIDFVNAISHGLDFRKLGTPAPFTFLMFFYPLVVLVIWGFLVGALYAWLHNLLHGGSRNR